MFDKVLYAGYLEAPKWGISRRKAQHPALISLETWERIQQRRNNNGYLPTRKDISQDFVMRGAVCCASCDKPYRAAWSKGEYKKYAYYVCQHKPCEMYGKSIQRDKLEDAFADLLQNIQPTQEISNVIQLMFRQAWDIQADKAKEYVSVYRKQLSGLEKEINQLLDRILDASSPRVVQAYEKRIDELENQKLVLEEKLQKSTAPKHSFEEILELSVKFLTNPYKIWASGRFNLRRMMLKLVFADRLLYCKKEGYRTEKITLIFSDLA